jgi:hypothetical protein
LDSGGLQTVALVFYVFYFESMVFHQKEIYEKVIDGRKKESQFEN